MDTTNQKDVISEGTTPESLQENLGKIKDQSVVSRNSLTAHPNKEIAENSESLNSQTASKAVNNNAEFDDNEQTLTKSQTFNQNLSQASAQFLAGSSDESISTDANSANSNDSTVVLTENVATPNATNVHVSSNKETAQRSLKEKIGHFLQVNILFVAISFGVSVYFIFHFFTFLEPIKYPFKNFMDSIVPGLIFTLLFIAFCKVETKRMKPRKWHFILIIFQVGVPFLVALLILNNPDYGIKVELEGVIACIICPTAAAASVITGKLGGDESSLTTYTILSNLGAAIGIPLIFPLISTTMQDQSFWEGFLIIMQKVFPMIVLPLFLAQFIRRFVKPLHRFIVVNLKELAFYLWAFTLSTVSATSVSNLMNSPESSETLINLALVGLITTAIQFAFGKFIGNLEGQRISAGQGLGQKNMVFGIWVAYAFLSPASSIAAGCYILWQNVVNSWQLWYRDRKKFTYTDKF